MIQIVGIKLAIRIIEVKYMYSPEKRRSRYLKNAERERKQARERYNNNADIINAEKRAEYQKNIEINREKVRLRQQKRRARLKRYQNDTTV